jgi:protein TonB
MSTDRADLSVPTSTRGLVIALVALVHVAAILGLIRAFAPDFSARVAEQVLATFNVTVVTEKSPEPPPPPTRAPEPAGEAAEIGKKAVPKEAAAPRPKIAIATRAAPPIAGKGTASTAGAAESSAGTGAGGQGSGTGSGAGGNGQGGGASLARKLELVAGNISSARDYPNAGREARNGQQVTIQIAVDSRGMPHSCRIVAPSSDPEADRRTCQLAVERFRFRPRLDPAGNPVAAEFQWRQRWWDPRLTK